MIKKGRKLGLVFPSKLYSNGDWWHHSALTPQPMLMSDTEVRIYCGMRDANGVSRIGYVDMELYEKLSIRTVSERPCLEIGRAGCFDDNGMLPCDVVRVGKDIYLFYVGFQLVRRAKFLAFTGLAISSDNGETFNRVQETPIMDRGPFQTTIGAVHTAIYENGLWKLWFAQGDSWETISGEPYPRYRICYTETKDLLNIGKDYAVCIEPTLPVYRIGRPKVYLQEDGSLLMIATQGDIGGEYYAVQYGSRDGISWNILNEGEPVIQKSAAGWDSLHTAYPTVIRNSYGEYVFYNGNYMGRDGFGATIRKNI